MKSFERPFAEIWQFTPFQPSEHVTDFVSNFLTDGSLDAERFWEFLASRTDGLKKPPRAVSRARRAATVGRSR
jgi:hypothetical protein